MEDIGDFSFSQRKASNGAKAKTQFTPSDTKCTEGKMAGKTQCFSD